MRKNSKRSALVARRAWRFLRLALIWARKGGILKNRIMLAKVQLIKTIKHHQQQHNNSSAIGYGERELSFDETPVIHLKMSRPSSLRFKMPSIPCINPAASPLVDFHYDFSRQPESWDGFDFEQDEEEIVSRKSFFNNNDDYDDDDEEEMVQSPNCGNGVEEKEAERQIDMKAEEFIAKFYQQMKLQRQISYLEYTEMINRGAS